MYNLYKFKNKLNDFKPIASYLIFGIFLLIFSNFQGKISNDLFDSIIYTSIYAIAGLGFALLLGYGGLASLGTGAFVGIGIFALHYLYKYMNAPVLIAIAVALLISIVVSIIFGFVSLRISGLYLAIVTLGLSQIVTEIIKNISCEGALIYASGTTPGFLVKPARALMLFGQKMTPQTSVILIAIFLFLAMVIVKNLMFSPTGRALLAIKNSQTAAQTMGVDIIKYRLLAFLISGVYGAVAGVLSILYKRTGNLDSIGLAFSLNVLAAVIIGGTKSIWGIFLGSFIIFGLSLAFLDKLGLGSFSLVVSGALIIIIVMFYPGGLVQIFADLKIKYLKWKNKRRDLKDEFDE